MTQKNSDAEQAEELTRYLQENAANNVTVREIADHMHMSPSMLYRFSQKLYGHSSMEEMTALRMKKARTLLATNLSVLDIALACGYSSLTSFGRKFRAYFGASPSEIRAQLEQPHTHRVVDAGKAAAFSNPWRFAINAGTFEMLLQKSVREQVLLMREELRFPYIRICNPFSDWVLMPEKGGKVSIQYSYLDEVLDFLHSCQLRPFIDLGIRAVQVIRDFEDLTYKYHHTVQTHTDYVQWERLIRNFIDHIIGRYGQEEVSGWIFEILQNPQSYDGDEAEKFFSFYDRIIGFLREKLPASRIGGCGWALPGHFEAQLKQISRMKNRPDFISIYFYCLSEGGVVQKISDLPARVLLLRELMTREGLDGLKVVLSEWNTEIMETCAYNDSARKAVDLLKLMSGNMDSVAMGAYCCLGDFRKESDRRKLFDGGLGLLTKNLIRKPAYFACQFLCRLGTELIGRGENYIVTRQDRTLQILAWQADCSGAEGEEGTQLDLTIEHLPDGNYLERRHQSGDSMRQYQNCRALLGDHPKLNEETVFRHLADPDISLAVRACRQNRLTVTIPCGQDQFCFLELIPV